MRSSLCSECVHQTQVETVTHISVSFPRQHRALTRTASRARHTNICRTRKSDGTTGKRNSPCVGGDIPESGIHPEVTGTGSSPRSTRWEYSRKQPLVTGGITPAVRNFSQGAVLVWGRGGWGGGQYRDVARGGASSTRQADRQEADSFLLIWCRF